MISQIAEDFLKSFDDSRFPRDFLQRYEQLECLAHHDMGETLLVRDRQTDVPYVAKCYTDFSLLSKTSESDLLGRLNHAGLPVLAGAYRNDQMLCVVREYAEGVSLSELARDGFLSNDKILSVAHQLCDILIYLHSLKPPVIHRDIKPQNIIISPNGSVKLIDFGISRTFDRSADRDTVFFGTMAYAPPEQYGFTQTDGRADIFSFGVLLCWMLTGHTRVEEAKIKDNRLRAVVRRCTAFAPRDRYPDVKALKRALLVKQKTPWQGIAAIAGVFALLLLGWGLWQNGRPVTEDLPAHSISDAAPFREPLLEQAARMTLGKGAGEPVSAEEWQSVTALYLFADGCYTSEDAFSLARCQWDHQIGPMESLEDLSRFPRLTTLYLGAQNLRDLSPVSGLQSLERIELRDSPVSDITPLAGLPKLYAVGLNGTKVTDLAPVIGLKSLRLLDLHNADHYDPSALTGINTLGFLDISNQTGSYKYLSGMTVNTLKIMDTDMDALSCLSGVKGLHELYLSGTKLTDLSGIEAHRELTTLNISRTGITDLSPLQSLPALQQVVLDASMEKAAETAAGASFRVVYE